MQVLVSGSFVVGRDDVENDRKKSFFLFFFEKSKVGNGIFEYKKGERNW